ncbi:hypothetical protein KWI06_12545 [Enterobacter cloacae]|uniref:hypothetical protein n=1 Tax=Enterobacter cloacae TaxID=550 RepID=UPI0018ACEB51|nr:hypothetical protein [Enterobacter cloacae]MCU6220574.1 hypothetical protein [Enterobacter cloacae]
MMPVSVFDMLIAEESSLTKIPFSKPVMFPLLVKLPCIVTMFTAFFVAEEIVAPALLLISSGCALVFISSPFEVPEIFPLFVIELTLNPEAETAAKSPDEDTVISLLMTYSVSAEKSCGAEVDWSMVPAELIIGVKTSRAGNNLPSNWVVLFNSRRFTFIFTSI